MQVSPPASSSSNGAPVRPSLITPIDGLPTSKRSHTRERSQGAVEMSVRQIEEARQASLGRVLDVWSRLEERYAVPLEDDDVVDISTGRIVEDRGVLRSMLANGPRLFGFAPANEDEAEPVTEAETDCEVEEEESDDELGRWPSDNANHMDSLRRRMQLDPLDKEDLESFLRAEHERRRLEDEADEDNKASSRATSPDLDAPLPEIYESDDGAQQLPPATSDVEGDLVEDSESEDELLLVDDDEAPSVTPIPTPVETQKQMPPPPSKLPLPTPPRSQSMDSRRALSVSLIKHPPPTPAHPARTPSRIASTPSSRSNVGASTSKPVFAQPAPPAPKRVMEVVLPLYNKPSSASSSSPQPKVSTMGRKHAAQVLPSPSPSVSDVPHVDFSRRRKSATPSPRKTQVAASSSPASAMRKATPAVRPVRQSVSVPATPSSSSKGKGRVHVPRAPSPTSEGEDPMALTSRTPSPRVTPMSPSPPPPPPHPSSSSSPRKRKRASNADAEEQLASPSKRRAQSRARERPKVENSPPSSPTRPTRPVAGPSAAPAMAWPGWPVQMPVAPPTFVVPGMPMHPQAAGGQQAFVAQFMAQVQHMNMLAQAMLPSFFPAALVPQPPPPPSPPPPSPPPPPPRARSVDSRSPEPEQRPRSRSALRKSTSSVERSGVRKHVSFLLQNDRQSDDEDTRGRVRYRGTPAPGRGEARSRTSSAPAR